MKTNERTSRTNDLHASALYKTNGIICDFADYYGRYPSVDEVRESWQMKLNRTNEEVTDEEIEQIIRKVERCDMGLWN